MLPSDVIFIFYMKRSRSCVEFFSGVCFMFVFVCDFFVFGLDKFWFSLRFLCVVLKGMPENPEQKCV